MRTKGNIPGVRPATAPAPKPARALAPTRIPATAPWTRRDTASLAIIAALALFTRAIGLTQPTAGGTPVFDEKHYVPQAWDMVRSHINPILGGIESNPGYGLVVHPPLGKQLLAIGEALFGYTPLGWRVMPALCGAGVVVFTWLLCRRLTQSTTLAFLAGLIAVFDGVLLVSSKFGMLDIFQVLFVVAAAWTLAGDMREVHQRMRRAAITGELGPRQGFRWWRFATGVLLGLALSVKWSGLYYIAFFGLLSSFWDLWLRRRYGARRPVVGTLLRDVPSALASLVAVPALIYVWSWRAWFASETSVYRHAATDGTIAGSDWPWLGALPDTVASWLYYHLSVAEFHASLTSSSGHSHPWDSKPWAWLAGARPILYYSATDIECGQRTCREMIFLFGTPAIWWLTVPVLLWAGWVWLTRRDFRVIVPVIAFGAGFLPWLAAFDRQMYFFYATALVPFSIVLIATALGSLASLGAPVRSPLVRRVAGYPITSGQLAVIGYLALVIAMFVYFGPILYGVRIPDSYYNSIMWLPSWR
ncbi:dolichyl-phosphate-mannose--protein mannosyltransferase [Corynebacterium liangguodongii]|uniref:Polyprenol-phosphate-mannose--protein mannosyltransferase n=2 Tax=Corynebacterium liangguodongii TaxID=2079535 RepID=A0A2S0WD49_9CORY|nr:phospholipid carrier-dependent glycosyltransferase [Corynebacterium liangguodongii]AWB83680.1 dolichyl-phosphate-mannose--protein mannosyltransferase [Corynebacterium liangguodongii]PWB99510.1 phospholipid carrier-dependent glycosyltransferase [Corynebacterium liangguodongii]